MRGQGDRAGCIRSHLEPATQCEAWLCCPRRGPAVPSGVTVLALSQSKAVASGESPSSPAPRQSDEKQRGEAQLGQSSACQPLSPERCLALSFPGLPGSWSSVRSPVYPPSLWTSTGASLLGWGSLLSWRPVHLSAACFDASPHGRRGPQHLTDLDGNELAVRPHRDRA